jgi:anti-anti-sigma factor
VSPRGELDIATAPCLELELDRAERTQPDLLLVDLHEVKFIDLRGIRVLLAAQDRARARGGELALLGAPAGVRRLLKLAGVDQLLHLIDDPAAAVPRGLLPA